MFPHLSEYELFHQILVLSYQLVVTHKYSLASGAVLCDLILRLALLLKVVSCELLSLESDHFNLLHFHVLFLLNLL